MTEQDELCLKSFTDVKYKTGYARESVLITFHVFHYSILLNKKLSPNNL